MVDCVGYYMNCVLGCELCALLFMLLVVIVCCLLAVDCVGLFA